MFMYLIHAQLTNPQLPLPEWFSDFIDYGTFSAGAISYPSFSSIQSQLSTVTDSKLITALALGGLPCYFSYFWTTFGTEDYILFLRSIIQNKPIYDSMLLMAFVSTYFLTFIASVFRPILSPLFPEAPLPSPEQLSNQIKTRWSNNANSIPEVIVKLLTESQNPVKTLSDGFFEFALKPSNARAFGFVEFFQILPIPLFDLLTQLLLASSPSNILSELIAITTASKSSEIPIFTEEDREAVPSLFQRMLMSPFDFNCYSAVSIQGQFVDPLEYLVSAYLRAGEVEEESRHNLLEQTMRKESTTPEAAIRHLLQRADPLPIFSEIAPDITIRSFFHEYLVNSGPLEQYPIRDQYCRILESRCRWEPSHLETAMKAATLNRTKEITALSTFARFTESYISLDCLSSSIRRDIEFVFVAVRIESSLRNRLRPRTIEDYSKDPNQLGIDFKTALNAAPDWFPYQTPFLSRIVFGLLTADFDFERFRNSRPNLRLLDDSLTSLIEKVGNDLVNGLFTSFPGWIVAQALQLRNEVQYLEIIRGASIESSPIRKVGEFGRGIQLVRAFFQSACSSSKSIGEDELLPCLVGYFYIANPPAMISNLIFIRDFCYLPEVEAFMEAELVSPISVLSVVCGNLPDFDEKKHARLSIPGI
jgi:hypothetical protein